MEDADFVACAQHVGLGHDALQRVLAVQQASAARGARPSLLQAACAARVLTPAQAQQFEVWGQELAARRAQASPPVAPPIASPVTSEAPASDQLASSSKRRRVPSGRRPRAPTPAPTQRASRPTTSLIVASMSVLTLGGLIAAIVTVSARGRPVAPIASAPPRPAPPPKPAPPPRPVAPPEEEEPTDELPRADELPGPVDEPVESVPDQVDPAERDRLVAEAKRLEREAANRPPAEQLALFERAVDSYEAALGTDSKDLGLLQAYITLGLLYHNDRQNYREATICCDKATELALRALRPTNPTLNDLRLWRARLLSATGDKPGALRILEEEAEHQERTLGPDHPRLGMTLSVLSNAVFPSGDLARARDIAARAVSILERAPEAKYHLETAEARAHLASALSELGELEPARLQLEQALGLAERARDAVLEAPLRRDLGDTYRRLGLYPEAHAALSRSLQLTERLQRGPDATALRFFGVLLLEMGLVGDARGLLQRALELTQRVEATTSSRLAQCRIDLSRALGPAEAIALLEPLAAGTPPLSYFEELPRRYVEAGQAARAKPLLETFISEYTRRSAGDSPAVASATALLARVHAALGELAPAQQALTKALAIQERTLPASHPDLLATRSAQASLLVRQDKPAEARALLEGVIGQTEAGLVRELAILSPRERLAAMARQQRVLAEWLTLCRATTTDDPGYGPVLRLKGLVGRRDEAEQRALRRADGETLALHATLRDEQRKLARLLYAGSGDAARAELAATKQRCDELERELARRSKDFAGRERRLALGVRDVQAQLKAGEALVDFVRDTERYVAFVLRAKGPARRFDLGDTTAVEAAVGLYRKALLDGVSGASLHSSGRSLRSLVWDPLAPALEGARVVLLVPDGALGSLPFAALPAREADRHLGEQVAFAHLATAQDLVPWPDERPAGRGALGFGGIDYDRAAAPQSAAAPGAAAPGGMGFAPLAATADEVRSCLQHYAASTKDESRVLTGREATEAAVRVLVPGRRVVHFATHGFVRLDLPSALASASGRADVSGSLIGLDPLLLSGLALAGASASRGGGADDGILTALEAAQLEMEGVDLVVLSACDTANGSAQAGEGVIGLLRGFRQSGARNAVASLWPVSDLATRVLMEVLYTRAFAGAQRRPIAVALNEAALALRDFELEDETGKPVRPFAHPAFWAAFVAYGPPR